MLCNMESAAADTIEALLRASSSTPLPAVRRLSRDSLVSRMAFVIEDRLTAGDSVTRADFVQALIPDSEIDELAAHAMALASARIAAIEANGVRRARVAARRVA